MKKCVILIPALDPPEDFVSYAGELQQAGFRDIIVVNDGSSSDIIFEQLRSMGVQILVHKQNEGKGQALKTGLTYYHEHYDETAYAGVITADSDGQHLCRDVRKIADELCKGSDKLILGSRDFSLPQVPPKSRYGNQTTARVFKWLLHLQINDTQTGLRGIPNQMIEECLGIPGKRFEYETTMLIELGKKYGILEIPITTVYYEANAGTHFNPVKDSIRIYSTIFGTFFRYVFSSLSASVLDLALFTLFSHLLPGSMSKRIFIATGLARVCSAVYNYCMNRNVVFKSKAGYGRSALRYGLLCVVQALLSASLVNGLFQLTQRNTLLLKVVVDTVLFFISYQVQKTVIFADKKQQS